MLGYIIFKAISKPEYVEKKTKKVSQTRASEKYSLNNNQLTPMRAYSRVGAYFAKNIFGWGLIRVGGLFEWGAYSKVIQ